MLMNRERMVPPAEGPCLSCLTAQVLSHSLLMVEASAFLTPSAVPSEVT